MEAIGLYRGKRDEAIELYLFCKQYLDSCDWTDSGRLAWTGSSIGVGPEYGY
jgi:hypothetical protein